MINSTGTCDGCGGKVRNIPSRRGCSIETLTKVHNRTCPGRPTNPDTPKD